LCVHTLKLLGGFYQGLYIVPPRSEGEECITLPPRKENTPMPKLPLQKPLKDRGSSCEILS
jgi:hypothetical protein